MKRYRSPHKTCVNAQKYAVSKKRRLDEKSETKIAPWRSKVYRCDVCEQPTDKVIPYRGPPIGSEAEFITITYRRLSILMRETEKQMYRLTDFCVYDKPGHLCPFDTGLIEAGKTLMACGFVKHICDEDPSRMNGIATCCIGPLEEWYIAGFNGGEKAIVGFSTKLADYYLLEPSIVYRPIMKRLEKKKNSTKLVIEFLLEKLWESPSYEDLLQWIGSHSNVAITEKTLLSHAQFICDQVMSFDAAGNSGDDVLITTPCMRRLIENADVTLKSTKHVRKFAKKPGPTSNNIKSTPLVRALFETFFADQIDSKQKRRRGRCGVCKPCQTPDCGKCSHCYTLQKFGGAGSSKQFCKMRRCSQLPHQEEKRRREDSDNPPPPRNPTMIDKLPPCSKRIVHDVRWTGEQIETRNLRTFYTKAEVGDIKVAPLDYVMLNSSKPYKALVVAQVVSIWENNDEALFHARLFCRGNETILGETANPRELFMVNECVTFPLGSIICTVKVERKYAPKDWALRGAKDKLPPQLEDDGENFFYSKSYDSKCSRFEDIVEKEKPKDVSEFTFCLSCKGRRIEKSSQVPKYRNGKVDWLGKRYKIGTAVYLEPNTITFKEPESSAETKDRTVDRTLYPEYCRKPAVNLHGSNVETPDPFCVGLIESVNVNSKQEIRIAVRKFHRPEDTRAGAFISYSADLNLVYWSADVYNVNFKAVKGKCYIANGNALDKSPTEWTKLGPHRFYFTEGYDETTGKYFKVPKRAKQIGIKIKSKGKGKGKGRGKGIGKGKSNSHKTMLHPKPIPEQKCNSHETMLPPKPIPEEKCNSHETMLPPKPIPEPECNSHETMLPPKPIPEQECNSHETMLPPKAIPERRGELGEGSGRPRVRCELPPEWGKMEKPLACMDIFSGCGGLSEGLRQSGVAEIRWAIEVEPHAAHAFKLNNPDSTVYTEDCNELLYKIMTGQKYHGRKLPQKGEVDMIVGGPPCQGFSGMNRFNNSRDSALNNSLIVSFLSYCDYYRPRLVVMENVREFSSFERSMVFKLTLCCFLNLGYQVTFGVLQAGNYGTPQSRRRLIIMAAAPGCVLPKFPEPQNTFNAKACQLAVTVDTEKYYTGAQWWASAPYRTLTVRDAIADLPDIASGANHEELPYDNSEAVSHFQRMMRTNVPSGISNHICKEMGPLVQSRISRIPVARGSDWRDLPNVIVELSDGSLTNMLEYTYRSCKQRKGPYRGVCACCTGDILCDPEDRQVNTLIPWSLPHTADKHNNWAGVYGRLDWEGFFNATVTIPDPMGKQGRVLHPEQDRIISVRECARSQGFPDSYKFYGNVLNKHRQIGNAVPPPLAAALGREIQKACSSSDNKS